MGDPVFFIPAASPTLAEIAALTGATLTAGADPGRRITGVASLDSAGSNDLTFIDSPRYLPLLATTRAAACLVPAKHLGAVPAGVAALESARPHDAYVSVLRLLFPGAMRPQPLFGRGIAAGAHVHAEARLEEGVTVEPGAVIGAGH